MNEIRIIVIIDRNRKAKIRNIGSDHDDTNQLGTQRSKLPLRLSPHARPLLSLLKTPNTPFLRESTRPKSKGTIEKKQAFCSLETAILVGPLVDRHI
jgi:hypothetical protein